MRDYLVCARGSVFLHCPARTLTEVELFMRDHGMTDEDVFAVMAW